MISQLSFSDLEESAKTKKTRKALFLESMEQVVPWQRLVDLILPYYPKGTRRPTIELERMLRLYFIQQWFGLADEACEDAVIETPILRKFLGINLLHEGIPDASTILRFRRLLEKHGLTKKMLDEVNRYLGDHGLRVLKGTIVDATIIAAPSSTKNKEKQRDPEMHSTKKGNQYYFGMKAHIGVDAVTGMVHSVSCTPANTADINEAKNCIHGKEDYVFTDAAYIGIEKREEHRKRKTNWMIAQKRNSVQGGWKKVEKWKARIRAKVEHMFGIIKCRFLYRKTRYKGLAKNWSQLNTLFALASLVKAKTYLLCPQERTA